jgi:hypothetical protein
MISKGIPKYQINKETLLVADFGLEGILFQQLD